MNEQYTYRLISSSTEGMCHTYTGTLRGLLRALAKELRGYFPGHYAKVTRKSDGMSANIELNRGKITPEKEIEFRN